MVPMVGSRRCVLVGGVTAKIALGGRRGHVPDRPCVDGQSWHYRSIPESGELFGRDDRSSLGPCSAYRSTTTPRTAIIGAGFALLAYRCSGTDGYAAEIHDIVQTITGDAPRSLDRTLADAP